MKLSTCNKSVAFLAVYCSADYKDFVMECWGPACMKDQKLQKVSRECHLLSHHSVVLATCVCDDKWLRRNVP